MPNSALPEHLKGKVHDDWEWPFCYVPRSWTSFKWAPPKLLIGYKVHEYMEIERDGVTYRFPDCCQRYKWSWHIGYTFWYFIPIFYFSLTLPIDWAKKEDGSADGFYLRLPIRYDTIDDYWTAPAFYLGRIAGRMKD